MNLKFKPVYAISSLLLGFLIFLYSGCVEAVAEDRSIKTVVKEELIPATPLSKTIDWYDQYLQSQIDSNATPGIVAAVVKGGKIQWAKAYGIRDIRSGKKVDIHTVFRLASLSKGFAGILTGTYVRDGLIDWDEKVLPHLTELKLPGKLQGNNLNIRHILSNSSGFPHHTYTNLLEEGVEFDRILDILYKVKSHAQPGEYFAYQNVVFNLIEPVLKSADGESYAAAMRKRLFQPLGMNRASVGYQPIQSIINLAHPHVWRDSSWHLLDIEKDFYAVPAAAGVNASISDMAKWLIALLGHKQEILPEILLKQAFAREIQTDTYRYRQWKNLKQAYYGMGWRNFEFGPYELVYHGGFVKGYRTEIGLVPKQDLGVVVLSNSFNDFTNLCIAEFFDQYQKQSQID